MSLFDPPAISVRKHLPSQLHAEFDELSTQVEAAVPAHLNATGKGLVVGYVMAAWGLAKHLNQHITLSEADGTYLSNMGRNCAARLGRNVDVATSMTNHLAKKGML